MSNDDVLKRLRDALEQAAGQYGPVTNEQRNEWMGLVQEVDGAAWFVRRVPFADVKAREATDAAETGDDSA